MPKVTLTFTLPKEKEEYQIHTHAMDLHFFVQEFANYLRSEEKYGSSPYTRWSKVREKFYELAKEYEFPSGVL